jgi:hypothetical protein
MGATVIVNSMTVVHKDSGGTAPSVPDFCKTPAPPGPPVPIPYPNLGKSSDTADGSTTFKADGNPVMLKTSKFSTSTGDEAGTLKGVASSTNMGVVKFALYSFDVKIQGKNVPRLGDPTTNNGNGANTTTVKELQVTSGVSDIQMTDEQVKAICEEFCKVKDDYESGELAKQGFTGPGCCTRALTKALAARGVAGLALEPVVLMAQAGTQVLTGTVVAGIAETVGTAELATLAGYTTGGAAAVPVWLGLKVIKALASTMSVWARIPDFMATIPGSMPPTTQVLDAKFPGDSWRDNQKPDYKRINKGKEPVTIDAATCGCT